MSPDKNTSDKKAEVAKEEMDKRFPLTRENYKWMIIGVIVVAIGYLLMIGGKSPNPDVYNYHNELFSFRRITLSPIIIVIGFLIEIYAIMKKPKKKHAEQ